MELRDGKSHTKGIKLKKKVTVKQVYIGRSITSL